MPLRAIICDLMDVLLRAEAPEARRSWEQRLGIPAGALHQTLLSSPRFPEAIGGQIPESALWQAVAETLGLEATPWQTLADAWSSAVCVNSELLAVLHSLRPRYKTAILTNAPSEMRRLVTDRFHLDREVDAILISAEERLRKPQAEFYRLAATRLGVQPDDALFIDDEARYIAGAQAVGMRGVQFLDSAQTITALHALLQAEG
jgi:HAD superfamily hydrolase (TIGR01509 family)